MMIIVNNILSSKQFSLIIAAATAAATTRSTANHSTSAQRSTSNHYVGQFTESVASAASTTVNAEYTSSGHQNYNIKWSDNTTNIFSSRIARTIYSGRL